jgi:DNA (cytosine-5)-methyltransferase 1
VGNGGSSYAAKPRPLDTPKGVVLPQARDALAAANLVRMNHGDKQWSSVEDPLGVVTGEGNRFGLVYSFLTKYFGTAIGARVEEPAPTVTSKHRFGVVEVQVDGQPYAIADIGMRMLEPRELARAQGFPDSYLLPGPKYAQVAAIGNSVCPCMAHALVKANFRPRIVRHEPTRTAIGDEQPVLF